jgi:hypothetical protein
MDDDKWLKNNWRCGHGWLRGEQCEICKAPKRPWVGLTDEEIQDLRLKSFLRNGWDIDRALNTPKRGCDD